MTLHFRDISIQGFFRTGTFLHRDILPVCKFWHDDILTLENLGMGTFRHAGSFDNRVLRQMYPLGRIV